MSDKPTVNVSATGAGWAVIWFFVLFWAASGWYRVDCALGEQQACNLITEEYAEALQEGKQP